MATNPEPEAATSTNFAPPLPPEVLGPILMTVSIKDIVSAQRVCRRWHAFVADCEPLQAAVHFRSVTAKPLARNPLKSTPHYASLSGTSLHGKTCKRLIVHPVLGRFLWNNTHKLKKAALSNSSASWRRALASQPAVKRLRILNVIVHAKDRSIGVTVQDVVDRMGWETRGWELDPLQKDYVGELERPRWQHDMVWEFPERVEKIVDVETEDANAEAPDAEEEDDEDKEKDQMESSEPKSRFFAASNWA